MRKIFIISAGLLTLGAAVVVGAIFAQTSLPRGAAISGQTRMPEAINTFPVADNPQARQSPANANQYGRSLPATLAQAQPRQGYPAHSPPAPPTGDGPVARGGPTAPGWQAPTGGPQYMVPHASPTRTAWVPDPDNPGQFKQVYFPAQAPGQAVVAVPLDEATQKIAILLRELREAQESSPNPEKLLTLRKWVAEQFDQRHKSQVARLETIQAELQYTQEILDRRNGQRDEIITRRVAQLLGEQDPLQWDYQPAVPQHLSPYQGYPPSGSAHAATSPGLLQNLFPTEKYAEPDAANPNSTSSTFGAPSTDPGPYPPQLPPHSLEVEAVQAAENAARRARLEADELQRRANSLRKSAQDSNLSVQSPDTIPAVEAEATPDTPPAVESPPSP